MALGKKFWGTVVFILITEMCERLAYYGLTGSLQIFFQSKLGMAGSLSSEMAALFSSLCYLTPCAGAYIADKYLGYLKTISVFSTIYVFGMCLVTASAYPPFTEWAKENGNPIPQLMSLVGLLGFVALGAGGIKPVVIVLGAEQFELPKEAAEKDSFFNYFYWSINLGCMVAFLYIANVALNGEPHLGIGPEYGFFASFSIPTGAFILGLCAFYSAAGRYVVKPPGGSAVDDFFKAVMHVSGSCKGMLLLAGGFIFFLVYATSLVSFLTDEETHVKIANYSMMGLSFGGILLSIACISTKWMLVEGHPDTADAADVVRLIPSAISLIFFWACYDQMIGNFIQQGCQMDLRVAGISLSPATLNVFDSGVIMLAVPIVDGVLYPALTNAGMPLSVIGKMCIGFSFIVAAMLSAGYAEVLRIDSPMTSDCTDLTTSGACPSACDRSDECLADPESCKMMKSLSFGYLIPGFAFVGLGEIFAAIPAYELFYSQVPEKVRSVCQAMNLLTTSFGGVVMAGINAIVSDKIPSDLNEGSELNIVYYYLAAFQACGLVYFLLMTCGFEFKEIEEEGDPSQGRYSGQSVGAAVPGTKYSKGIKESIKRSSRASAML